MLVGGVIYIDGTASFRCEHTNYLLDLNMYLVFASQELNHAALEVADTGLGASVEAKVTS